MEVDELPELDQPADLAGLGGPLADQLGMLPGGLAGADGELGKRLQLGGAHVIGAELEDRIVAGHPDSSSERGATGTATSWPWRSAET